MLAIRCYAQFTGWVQAALAEAAPPQSEMWLDSTLQAVSARCTAIATLSVGDLDERDLPSPSELEAAAHVSVGGS